MDSIRVALTYAPLGVRDAAQQELNELRGRVIRALVMPNEAQERLLAAYNDASLFFQAIGGLAPCTSTYESLAREWLMRHAPQTMEVKP